MIDSIADAGGGVASARLLRRSWGTGKQRHGSGQKERSSWLESYGLSGLGLTVWSPQLASSSLVLTWNRRNREYVATP